MTAEQWRPVLGWESLYEVSSHGRVRAVYREGKGSAQPWKRPGVRKLTQNAQGYMVVRLSGDGRRLLKTVHVLVAEVFYAPRPEWATQVNHKDKDRTNNFAANLEWSDSRHNVRHCFARYPWEGRLRSCAELAESAGINQQTLYMRLTKRGWSVEKAISTPVRGTK